MPKSYPSSDEPTLPCADKLAFENRQQASVAANVAAYQHGAKLKAYHCRHCQLWHLATKIET